MGKESSIIKNKGKEYELFVKSIYERLNAVDGLKDVSIQHNVILTDSSNTKHQIDLFWEFSFAGVPYKVAVECKDYKTPVSIDRIKVFRQTLSDIGGLKGIFATSSGFQKGALEYAKKNGIETVIIRKPTDEDWKGRIRKIHISVHLISIGKMKASFIIDEEKAKTAGIIGKLPILTETSNIIRYDKVMSEDGVDEDEIVKLNERKRASIHELINCLPRKEGDGKKTVAFHFENALGKYGDIEIHINGILFQYDVVVDIIKSMISGDDAILAIVKNMYDKQNGNTKIVDNEGNVWDRA